MTPSHDHLSACALLNHVGLARYSGELQVTLIATGFDQDYEEELLGNAASGRRPRRQQQQQQQAAADSQEDEEGGQAAAQEAPAAARVRQARAGSGQQQQGGRGAGRWGSDSQAAPLPWRTTRSYTGRPLL